MSDTNGAPDLAPNILHELRHARAGAVAAWVKCGRAEECATDPVDADLLRLATLDAEALARRLDRLILRFNWPPSAE